MSFLKHLFGSSPADPKSALLPLYNQIVSKARELHWYQQGAVPDTLDGRFDMVAAVLTLVLLRLEDEAARSQSSVHLTEIFVDDMDGQLRESGVGDVTVGKYMGKMMSALGGRLGAFRSGFAKPELLDEAIQRNIYRGDGVGKQAFAHVKQSLHDIRHSLASQPAELIVERGAKW